MKLNIAASSCRDTFSFLRARVTVQALGRAQLRIDAFAWRQHVPNDLTSSAQRQVDVVGCGDKRNRAKLGEFHEIHIANVLLALSLSLSLTLSISLVSVSVAADVDVDVDAAKKLTMKVLQNQEHCERLALRPNSPVNVRVPHFHWSSGN